jgi:hypothetical protein
MFWKPLEWKYNGGYKFHDQRTNHAKKAAWNVLLFQNRHPQPMSLHGWKSLKHVGIWANHLRFLLVSAGDNFQAADRREYTCDWMFPHGPNQGNRWRLAFGWLQHLESRAMVEACLGNHPACYYMEMNQRGKNLTEYRSCHLLESPGRRLYTDGLYYREWL